MTTTYTATVAIIDPEGNVLLTAAQAPSTTSKTSQSADKKATNPPKKSLRKNGGPPNYTSATRAETSPPSGSNHLPSLLCVPLPALAGELLVLLRGVDTMKPRSSIEA